MLKIDEEALFAIAKAASGSLRDALSILDQLGVLTQRNIKVDDVTSMLGMVEIELLFRLTDCLAKKDCAGALQIFDQIIGQGKDIRQLSRDVIEHFRNLMIIKVGGKSLSALVDYPIVTKEMLLTQSEKFTLKEIIDSIEAFMESQEASRIMDSLRIPLEVAFAKLTYKDEAKTKEHSEPQTSKPNNKSINKTSSQSVESHWPSPLDVLTNQKGHVDFSVNTPKENEEEAGNMSNDLPNEMTIPVTELTLEGVRKAWDTITHAISREKMSVATFLQEGSPYDVKGPKLTISFPKEATFHKESLEEKDNLKLIEKVFSEKLKANIKIDFKIVDDHKPQEDEPFIKTALETFQGKVVSKWHQD